MTEQTELYQGQFIYIYIFPLHTFLLNVTNHEIAQIQLQKDYINRINIRGCLLKYT